MIYLSGKFQYATAYLIVCVCVLLTAGVQNDALAQAKAQSNVQSPAGTYKLDPSHASLVFSVNHLGFSNYTASFSSFDATLEIDPSRPADAKLEATVEVSSLLLPAPPGGFLKQMLGRQWFNARRFANMTFESIKIEKTGASTARVTGTLTLLGVSKPMAFNVTFNGGNAGVPGFTPRARIGFSAHGTLNRSDFGMTTSLPPDGSTRGVGDTVEFRIEAEFSGPSMAEAPPA